MTTLSPLLSNWLHTIKTEKVIEILCEISDESAIIIIDSTAKILLWNRGAENIIGHHGQEVIGKKIDHFFSMTEGFFIADNGLTREKVRLSIAGKQTLLLYRQSSAFFDTSGQYAGSIIIFNQQEKNRGNALSQRLPDVQYETFHGLITRSQEMRQAFQIIRNAAETDTTILIRGESGTGKELAAKALHNESHRHEKPFLAVNCAALTPTLLESELFGHVKGAFTGAVKEHLGLFERADQGTLFLDEVAELPMELQAKLLRVLQEKSFVRVGGEQIIDINVRIIAATHRSLREEVKTGRFREDLMYRLRVVPVFLPALRERRQDITLLLWHFIDLFNARGLRHISQIDSAAMRLLLDHAWPGNVRELQNVVEYAFVVGREESMQVEDLPPEFRVDQIAQTPSSMQATITNRPDEETLLRQALHDSHGNIDEAAKLLGISRATFWRKRKKYGINNH